MKILLVLALIVCAFNLDNGLGRTPAMGWNSWNHFGCNINETTVKETADILVATGLAAKGYKYLNIDDCWQIARNQTSLQIIPDSTRFPNGMAVLADYAHQRGLLFGLYSDAGTKTCQGRPGSYDHETIDANTYAKWKIDYLKYDNCHNEGLSPKFRYPLMRDALNKTGRPIYFSMCEWGRQKPYEWAQPIANSWRTTLDISDNYLSMVQILDRQKGLSAYAGPGAWNDPDMLEVGNGKMTNDQYQSHFSLWAALKAPLIIGCSLKNITNATLQILGNSEVIAINQDPLGRQADLIHRQIHDNGEKEIWGGELSNNNYVLVFFNRLDKQTTFTFSLQHPNFRGMKVVGIRDVIAHSDVTVPTTTTFTTKTIKKRAVANYIFKLGPRQQMINLQTQ